MLRLGAVLLTLALFGCGGEPRDDDAKPGMTPAPMAAAPSPGTTASASASSKGGASAVDESTDLYEFDFSYPAAAGRIPALRAWLDEQRTKARADLIESARESQAEARKVGFEHHPYAHPYASGRVWETVAETPRFLSLSAQVYEYTGGAHPNHWFDALLWDKQAGRRLAALDLFVSPAAFDRAVQPRFCVILDRQRATRRGEPVRRDSGDPFDECIEPSGETVILGSSSGTGFDRIGVLVAPYNAGPYAEGDYEITLPVTPALLQAVKPEYRDAFAVR